MRTCTVSFVHTYGTRTVLRDWNGLQAGILHTTTSSTNTFWRSNFNLLSLAIYFLRFKQI
jgi:hypothetical protein